MRFMLIFGSAALVTLMLFYLMHYMISGSGAELKKNQNYSTLQFIRLKRESETEVNKRVLPKKPPPPKEPPSPPPIKVAKTQNQAAPNMKMAMPKMGDMKVQGEPFLGDFSKISPAADSGSGGMISDGEIGSDGDVIPLLRIQPRYPRKAAMKGIQGWVEVAFTILENGTVKDVAVVKAKPRRIFNKAAVRAIQQWKFKPRVIDGKPVQRRATQIIDFNLEKK